MPETAAPYTTLLMQLGVGGIFAVLVIREVLSFLKSRNGHGHTSGDQPSEYWRKIIQEITHDALRMSVIPILDNQTRILGEIQATNRQLVEGQIRAAMVLEELKGGQEHLRASTHEVNNKLGVVITQHRVAG